MDVLLLPIVGWLIFILGFIVYELWPKGKPDQTPEEYVDKMLELCRVKSVCLKED